MLSGQCEPGMCMYSNKSGFGFQRADFKNVSCGIKITFERCWIGVCSNFSLTTNVNSYQRWIIPNQRMLFMFQWNWVVDIRIFVLWELFEVSGVGWFLGKRFKQTESGVSKNAALFWFTFRNLNSYAQGIKGPRTKCKSPHRLPSYFLFARRTKLS